MSSRAHAPLTTTTRNIISRAFNRNIGPQASVSSTAVDAQNIVTSNSNDRVDIRATAFNRRGYAEAIGLDSSSLDTGSGNDRVRISARANGQSTNAWAMRDSSLDTGSGNDRVDLNASTRWTFDPAWAWKALTRLRQRPPAHLR